MTQRSSKELLTRLLEEECFQRDREGEEDSADRAALARDAISEIKRLQARIAEQDQQMHELPAEHPPQLMAVVDKWQDYVNDMRNGHLPPYSSHADTVERVLRDIRTAAHEPKADVEALIDSFMWAVRRDNDAGDQYTRQQVRDTRKELVAAYSAPPPCTVAMGGQNFPTDSTQPTVERCLEAARGALTLEDARLHVLGAMHLLRASQPPGEGWYTMSQISYALNRSLYAKTGNVAIEGIIEDLHAALKNGGDYPSPTKSGDAA